MIVPIIVACSTLLQYGTELYGMYCSEGQEHYITNGRS